MKNNTNEVKMKLEYVSLDSVMPFAGNPKIHSKEQVKLIADSIRILGYNSPTLVDENNVILAGHGRYLAAMQLKLDEIPIIKLTHLSEGEKRVYRLADNKLTERGDWDKDLLKIEFSELEKMCLDFSLGITGFTATEIDFTLDDSLKDQNTIDKLSNAVPFIPENEVISKLGDIWLLGPHRVICGNALEEKYYKSLMTDKFAQMISVDPPYNVKINGHVCGNGKVKHSEFPMASGELTSGEFQQFLETNMEHLKKFSIDGSLHYLFMDWRHIKEIILAGDSVYDKLINLCVWNKSNGGMGSLYRSKHELVFVFKHGSASHTNNVELGKNGRYRTNVWDYAGINSFGKEQKNLKMHPTVKPIEMVRDAILDVTKRGDIVLDAFLGSGTTLIAAEKVGRICYGMELEPLYVDTTIRRFQDLTGIDAIQEKTGKTYDELLKAKIESEVADHE